MSSCFPLGYHLRPAVSEDASRALAFEDRGVTVERNYRRGETGPSYTNLRYFDDRRQHLPLYAESSGPSKTHATSPNLLTLASSDTALLLVV